MAFEKNITSINLNTDIASFSSGVKTTSDAPVSISMTTKIVLTEQQKQEMLLLGLDPDNESQVNQFLSMSPEDITALKETQMAQISNITPIEETPAPITNNEQIVQQQTPNATTANIHTEHTHHTEPTPQRAVQEAHTEEHNHDLDIDTTSAEWELMSNTEKLNAILTAGAKKTYTDEEWSALSEEEKQNAKTKFLNDELSLHYPGWKDAKTVKDQLNLLSEFIDENKMAKAFNIPFNELVKLKVNNPSEYQKIATEFYQTHDKTDLYTKAAEKRKAELAVKNDAYKEALQLYCKDNNLDIKSFKNSSEITEFNKNYAKQFGADTLPESAKLAQYYALLKEANIDKNDTQKRYEFINNYIEKYGEEFLPADIKTNKLAIEELVKVNGGSFEGLSDGTTSINDLFSNHDFVTNTRGHIDWKSSENINKADAILREKLGITKEDDANTAIEKILASDLDASAKTKAIEILMSKQNKNQIILPSNQNHTRGRGPLAFLITAISNGNTGRNEQVFDTLVEAQYNEIKKTGGNTEYLNESMKKAAQNFEQENAAQLPLLGARLNDKSMINATNEGIAQREDVLEVLKLSNKLFNESDTISDEMKEFYAQNSIEHLQTPEQRASQAEDLRSYNNNSFNSGVTTGLENVATNKTSSTTETPASQYENNYDTASAQTIGAEFAGLTKAVQEVKNALLNPTSEVSQREALEMFADLPPKEQMELINSLTPQQIAKFPITLCEEFPQFIPKFVQEGKGEDLLRNGSPYVAGIAMRYMKTAGRETQLQLNKFIAAHPAQYTQITLQNAKDALGLNKKQTPEKPINLKA